MRLGELTAMVDITIPDFHWLVSSRRGLCLSRVGSRTVSYVIPASHTNITSDMV